MRQSQDKDRLEGRIEMDDAYLRGERSGGKTGRGSPGKTSIVVAVETTGDGKPTRIKLRRISRFKRKRIKSLVKRIAAAGATVVTDGLACFTALQTRAVLMLPSPPARVAAPSGIPPSNG